MVVSFSFIFSSPAPFHPAPTILFYVASRAAGYQPAWADAPKQCVSSPSKSNTKIIWHSDEILFSFVRDELDNLRLAVFKFLAISRTSEEGKRPRKLWIQYCNFSPPLELLEWNDSWAHRMWIFLPSPESQFFYIQTRFILWLPPLALSCKRVDSNNMKTD